MWVVDHMRSRGIEVLLNTSLANAEGGLLKLINMADKSPAQEFEADTLIWTAGVQANPMVRSTDFNIEPRGRVTTGADLRIVDAEGNPLEGAWAAGDVAAVPDLTGGLPDGTCVPNAQHAVRQAKRLAKNLYAARYGVGPSRSTSTRTSAPSPASAPGRASPRSWASSSRAGRPGWRTAATTAWPCRRSSASSASSAAGSGPCSSTAT